MKYNRFLTCPNKLFLWGKYTLLAPTQNKNPFACKQEAKILSWQHYLSKTLYNIFQKGKSLSFPFSFAFGLINKPAKAPLKNQKPLPTKL